MAQVVVAHESDTCLAQVEHAAEDLERCFIGAENRCEQEELALQRTIRKCRDDGFADPLIQRAQEVGVTNVKTDGRYVPSDDPADYARALLQNKQLYQRYFGNMLEEVIDHDLVLEYLNENFDTPECPGAYEANEYRYLLVDRVPVTIELGMHAKEEDAQHYYFLVPMTGQRCYSPQPQDNAGMVMLYNVPVGLVDELSRLQELEVKQVKLRFCHRLDHCQEIAANTRTLTLAYENTVAELKARADCKRPKVNFFIKKKPKPEPKHCSPWKDNDYTAALERIERYKQLLP